MNIPFILSILWSATWALQIPQDAQLVAATVAKIQDKTIVTLNDVKISKTIEKHIQLAQHLAPSANAPGEVQMDDVSKTVLEKVTLLDAESFKYSNYDSSLLQKVKESLIKAKALEPFGIKAEKDIEQQVRQKLTAKSFIALRSENLKTIVNETELRSYYDKNRAQFSDMPFEKFQNTIREYYLKEKLNEKLNEWFSILKTKYQVRIYDNHVLGGASAE